MDSDTIKLLITALLAGLAGGGLSEGVDHLLGDGTTEMVEQCSGDVAELVKRVEGLESKAK